MRQRGQRKLALRHDCGETPTLVVLWVFRMKHGRATLVHRAHCLLPSAHNSFCCAPNYKLPDAHLRTCAILTELFAFRSLLGGYARQHGALDDFQHGARLAFATLGPGSRACRITRTPQQYCVFWRCVPSDRRTCCSQAALWSPADFTGTLYKRGAPHAPNIWDAYLGPEVQRTRV